MDKFHIYEEIGKGKKSQVYKGREKSTIKYVAIKRVDKSEMTSISSQVALMHRFNSPHVLKFHDWYETRNNLWLILEYAPGGDLKTLLETDMRMPEESIKMFGVDIVAGLLYLHSQGVLYADLKPSNILVDEFGVLKLADFGLARRIPTASAAAKGGGSSSSSSSSTSASPLAAADLLPPNSASSVSLLGTPHYMAPELFKPHGVHSYASELWSLGVVLYEMFYGAVPFSSHDLSSLIAAILHDPPSFERKGGEGSGDELNETSSTTPSTEPFHDLLTRLLQKDPLKRPTWAELLRHPFWDVGGAAAAAAGGVKGGSPPPSVTSATNPFIRLPSLPPQPLFDKSVVRALVEAGWTEEEASESLRDARPENVRKNLGGGVEGMGRRDGSEWGRGGRPVRLTDDEDRGRDTSKRGGAGRDSKPKVEASIVRLSQAVASNLRRSKDAAESSGDGGASRSSQRRWDRDDEQGSSDDVKLVGTDTVLDFTDHDVGGTARKVQALRAADDDDDQPPSSGAYDDDVFDDESVEAGSDLDAERSDAERQRSPASRAASLPGSPSSRERASSKKAAASLQPSSPPESDLAADHSCDDLDDPFSVSDLNITAANATGVGGLESDDQGPATEIDNLSACDLVDDAERAMQDDYDEEEALDSTRVPEERRRCAAHPFQNPASSALALILHSSDATVKPIVGNKSIEAAVKLPVYRVSAITSIAIKTRAEIKALGEGPGLEAYFGTVYKCLASSSTQANEKGHIFGYLYSVCDIQSVANLIANSSFVTLLLRMIRKKTGGDAGRISLAFILGVVIRHTSFIAPDASEKDEGLLHVLTGIVREGGREKNKEAPLRRRGVAALGELIFYIATGADGEGWVLPADTINTLSKCLTEDEDPVVSLYAAKVVENVLAQAPLGDSVSKRLCTQEIAQKLVEMSQLPHGTSSKNKSSLSSDATLTIASAALSQLLSHLILGCGAGGLCSNGSLDLSSSKISFADWSKGIRLVARVLIGGGNQEHIDAFKLRIIFGINDANDPKMQQAWLNIINLLLWDGPSNPATKSGGGGGKSGSGDTEDLSSPTPRDSGIPTALKLIRSAMTVDTGVDQENSGHRHNQMSHSVNLATNSLSSTPPSPSSSHQQIPVVAHLMRLAERGENPIVRGKALIATMGLCKISASTLSYSCDKRLLQVIERIGAKGEDLKSNEYFWSCASSLVAYLTSVPGTVLRNLACESERYVGVGATADMLQQQRREMRVITDKAIRYLPCVAQFVGCGLLREQGCVTSVLVQDLGWALHTFGIQQDQQLSLFTAETQQELTRLLMLVLEKMVQHSEECVFRHCGDFIESTLPILFRFLSSTNDDLSLSSLSLLRIILPGIFVHVRVYLNVDAAQSNSIKSLLLNLCERHLLPAVGPLLKKDGTISQYALLLLSELAGAAEVLYGTGAKAVWSGLSSAIMRSSNLSSQSSSLAIVKVLADKVKAVANGGGEGGSSVLPNCICALIENGFKESLIQRTKQLPSIMSGLLGHSFVSRVCKCLYGAISRNDSAATQAWLHCCKSMMCVVTAVLPADSKSARSPVKGKAAGAHTPLESPPPVARGEDEAWGSSILSPGDLERLNLRGGKKGGVAKQQQPDREALLNTCGQAIDELAASSVLLVEALTNFDAGVSHKEAIDDLASWLLSAVATLSPDVCFEKWLDERDESGAMSRLTDTVRAYLNSSDKSRILVRALRVLYIAAMRGGALLREIANNYVLADYLRKLTTSSSKNGGRVGATRNEPAVEVAGDLLTLLSQFASRKVKL